VDAAGWVERKYLDAALKSNGLTNFWTPLDRRRQAEEVSDERHRPRAGRRFLAGFVLLAVLSGITLGIAKVTTTLYALSLQATPLELALLGAAQSVGILAVSLPVGLMVDRYGARRLFVIGSLLVTVLRAGAGLGPAGSCWRAPPR
jgi:nitrate/nitrite transporter NarK